MEDAIVSRSARQLLLRTGTPAELAAAEAKLRAQILASAKRRASTGASRAATMAGQPAASAGRTVASTTQAATRTPATLTGGAGGKPPVVPRSGAGAAESWEPKGPWRPDDISGLERDWKVAVESLYREAGGTGVLDSYAIVNRDGSITVAIEGSGIKVMRVFYWDRGEVYHQYFALAEHLQKHGIATRLNAAMFRQYKASGFRYVTVHAALDKGGYAWARQRFLWDGNAKTQATAILERMWAVINRRGATYAERRGLEEMERRVARGDIPDPFDLSQVGRTPGADSWLGKEAMMGSSWHGRKDL